MTLNTILSVLWIWYLVWWLKSYGTVHNTHHHTQNYCVSHDTTHALVRYPPSSPKLEVFHIYIVWINKNVVTYNVDICCCVVSCPHFFPQCLQYENMLSNLAHNILHNQCTCISRNNCCMYTYLPCIQHRKTSPPYNVGDWFNSKNFHSTTLNMICSVWYTTYEHIHSMSTTLWKEVILNINSKH